MKNKGVVIIFSLVLRLFLIFQIGIQATLIIVAYVSLSIVFNNFENENR